MQELGHAQRLDESCATDGGTEIADRAAMAIGPELLVHIAAGNIPNPTLMSMVLGVLTRSAQFVKCASGSSLSAAAVRALALRGGTQAGRVPGNCRMARRQCALGRRLFAEADCVTATGSDETLAAIRQRAAGQNAVPGLRPSRQFRLCRAARRCPVSARSRSSRARRRTWWPGTNWVAFRRT